MDVDIPHIVGELIKNSIDARCNVVAVEFNASFDLRVIDDGFGIDEHTMHDIGERQLYLSDSLDRNHFRYGTNGKFLFNIAREAGDIFIESIKRNSDVRLYKSVITSKSIFKVYSTDRSYEDATVTTDQGSMVVLSTLNVSIGDEVQLKTDIVNTVIELALVNFGIDISVSDTATQQTLYESPRAKSLFEKFEQFLESRQFFSKIHSVTCEKYDVKVELFLCEDGTQHKTFQFVYFNQLSEQHNGKWKEFVDRQCRKRFEKDLNSKCAVYLVNITVKAYKKNQLANNTIIDKCIRKCMEQLFQLPTPVKDSGISSTSQTPFVNNPNATHLEGVRLGDYIFNNTCVNYEEELNRSSGRYRNKICEKWVISLEKPKPKDTDDSLASIVINEKIIQPVASPFKVPKPKTTKPKHKNEKKLPKSSESATKKPRLLSSQIFQPSPNVKAFNNSSLIRTSKELILKESIHKKSKRSKEHRVEKRRIEKRQSTVRRDTLTSHRKPLELSALPREDSNVLSTGPAGLSKIDTMPNIFVEDQIIGCGGASRQTFEALQHFSTTKRTVDFKMYTTNFDMNFSSSFATHAVNEDPFVKFLDDEYAGDNNSLDLFESNNPPARTRTQTQRRYEETRPSGLSSVYSSASQFRYRHRRNETIRTQYSQRTYRTFGGDVSSTSNRTGTRLGNAGGNEGPRSNFAKNPSNVDSGTSTVVSSMERKITASVDPLSHNLNQMGWPVTININFGLAKSA